MSNKIKKLTDILNHHINGRRPNFIKLIAENPWDPTTPVGKILCCTGWGTSDKYIAYNVPGWDNVGDNKWLMVADHNNTLHVVPWDDTLWKNSANLSQFAIQELAYDIEDWAEDDRKGRFENGGPGEKYEK